jgi:signal transduction histidine kinase
VRDEGVGMAAADIERMFQPFQSGFRQGSGLGLAIVRRIVTDHGGRVSVQSAPGAGTEVVVALPVTAARLQLHPARRSA